MARALKSVLMNSSSGLCCLSTFGPPIAQSLHLLGAFRRSSSRWAFHALFDVAPPTRTSHKLYDARLLCIKGEWTGARELTITLGYEAYIVPEPISNASCTSEFSCITLMDGGVRTEAFAVLSSSGSTPVLAPANPVLVSAVLVAPQVWFGTAYLARKRHRVRPSPETSFGRHDGIGLVLTLILLDTTFKRVRCISVIGEKLFASAVYVHGTSPPRHGTLERAVVTFGSHLRLLLCLVPPKITEGISVRRVA